MNVTDHIPDTISKSLPSGFYPFWFWNGRLTEEEIRWQVAEMAAHSARSVELTAGRRL